MDTLESLEECRRLNEAYQAVLEQIEVKLLHCLDECRNELVLVNERIQSVQSGGTRLGNMYFMFGIPYFKDKNYFPSPLNEDAIDKQRLDYPDPLDLPPLRPWKDSDKSILENAIRSVEIAKLVAQNECEQEELRSELERCKSKSEMRSLEEKLKDCEQFPSVVNNFTLEQLVESRMDEYDWLKISIKNLNCMRTEDECRAMWFHYLHPKINTGQWTSEEDEHLKILAKEYAYQDWKAIAKKLGTGRSGHQCIIRYQRDINEESRKCKWTSEEDDRLRNLVKRFQRGRYVPWSKVTYYMDGRTKLQVYNHWIYAAKPSIKKGKFTSAEDIIIIAGVRRFGLDFGPISQYLPNRTVLQVRQRFYTLLHAQVRPSHWTMENDILLLKLVRKYGEKWSLLRRSFTNRTNMQLRKRYATLKRWLMMNPKSTVPKVISRSVKKCKSIEKIWEDVQRVVQEENITHTQVDGKIEVDCKSLHELSNKLLQNENPEMLMEFSESDKLIYYRLMTHFRYTYMSQGGSAKVRCCRDTIPNLSYYVTLFLSLMGAVLNLPSDTKKITNDRVLSYVDKCIFNHLIRGHRALYRKRKEDPSREDEATDGKSIVWSCISIKWKGFIAAGESRQGCNSLVPAGSWPNCKNILYLCPPSFTSVVGLRTFILNCRHLKRSLGAPNVKEKDDSNVVKEEVLQDNDQVSENSVWSDQGKEALLLWKKRLASLFMWPGFMSNKYPTMRDGLFSSDTIASQVDHEVQMFMAPGNSEADTQTGDTDSEATLETEQSEDPTTQDSAQKNYSSKGTRKRRKTQEKAEIQQKTANDSDMMKLRRKRRTCGMSVLRKRKRD